MKWESDDDGYVRAAIRGLLDDDGYVSINAQTMPNVYRVACQMNQAGELVVRETVVTFARPE